MDLEPLTKLIRTGFRTGKRFGGVGRPNAGFGKITDLLPQGTSRAEAAR